MRKFVCKNCGYEVECLGEAVGHYCDVRVHRDGSRSRVAKRYVERFYVALDASTRSVASYELVDA